MRTRTLLLLAIFCGLAILVAGGVQLLRLAGDDGDTAENLSVGDTARAGDLSVTVIDAVEDDGLMRVTVRLGGVDDPSGLDDFQLIVSGARVEPLGAVQAGEGACAAFTMAEQTCDLVFGTADNAGRARVLLLLRGEDRVRWDLARLTEG
ncbi:MAG: hypothetical protein KDB40_24805 [Acidimicrobiales bacterium]|nr:hypothetical protein [Acidimicrobiales bacterium]MCB9394725.1 hypothetical protein [Acidimicrobiaceae bacterium]